MAKSQLHFNRKMFKNTHITSINKKLSFLVHLVVIKVVKSKPDSE